MKVLIIGMGSIASKHVNALRTIDPEVQCIALRRAQSDEINGVKNIYNKAEIPSDIDFVIISNPSSLHFETIAWTIQLGKPLFIEKPTLTSLEGVDELLEKIDQHQIITYSAFNMRFHPVIQWLKKHLSPNDVVECNAYCGSYLPDWRPHTDYRQSYSAQAELGGGVHLDLIHEIDYVVYLLGFPERTFGFAQHASDLEINSTDIARYVYLYTNKTAGITLNYYRRDATRHVEFIMKSGTWMADLLKNTVINERGETLFSTTETMLDSYVHQMRYFINCLKNNNRPMNSLADSMASLQICLNYVKR
ncbi:MAG: Gfo/Idh/MocA family protein [Flavobacteriales bacterium]